MRRIGIRFVGLGRLEMIRRTLGLAASLLVAIVITGSAIHPARASVVVYHFTGVVNDVDTGLAGTFSVGQLLDGYYSFDSTVAARLGSNSNFAVFDALKKTSCSAVWDGMATNA